MPTLTGVATAYDPSDCYLSDDHRSLWVTGLVIAYLFSIASVWKHGNLYNSAKET